MVLSLKVTMLIQSAKPHVWYVFSFHFFTEFCSGHNLYGFLKLLLEGKGGAQRITDRCKKEINCVNQKLNITLTRITNPYGHPNILAKFIAGQLKNRVSFQKAMKKAIELTETSRFERKGLA